MPHAPKLFTDIGHSRGRLAYRFVIAGAVGGLAVCALLSLMGQGGVKPRHRLDEMTGRQRIVSGLGLYSAVALHGYAIIYATDRLLS